jgi:murein DD-endopeptidase MepM/ murein hydrolase activator NlpD
MKLLKCYPFIEQEPAVRLVEGFKAYDGVLGDEKGGTHKGIDYARQDSQGRFVSFEVFSTHDGEAFQDLSKSWGKFVIIYKQIKKEKFATVYAHLRQVSKNVPNLPKTKKQKLKGLKVKEGQLLGRAGTTGWTKRKIQLHFELLKKDLAKKEWQKLDPYGVYDVASSKKYPQPSQSLKGLDHYWVTNNPLFS